MCVCVCVCVKINNKDIRTAPLAAVFIVNFDYIIYYINILARYTVIYISIYLYITSYRNNVQILPQIQRWYFFNMNWNYTPANVKTN